jgi:hypothetical protein
MKRTKPVNRYQLRDGDQIPTRLTTAPEIMTSRTFALGVEDVRAGRGIGAARGCSAAALRWPGPFATVRSLQFLNPALPRM